MNHQTGLLTLHTNEQLQSATISYVVTSMLLTIAVFWQMSGTSEPLLAA